MKKRIVSLLLAVTLLLGVVSVGVSAENEPTGSTENTQATENTEATEATEGTEATEATTESTAATEPSTEPTEPPTEPTEPDTGFHASDECIAILKAEEGFSRVPYWDYAQYTVGYGTRCPDDKLEEYTKNGITEAEAEILLRDALNGFENSINTKLIERYGLTVTQNQFDAMLLFSYNCGTSWLTSSTNDNLRKAIIAGAIGNELIDRFTRWCNAGGQIRTYLLRRRLSEANMYLNGVYSQRPPENYAYVLYDANGGVSNPNVQGFDTNLTSQIIPIPTYEGHTFKGWYTAATGGTQVTVLDANVKNSRLYAQWEANAGSSEPPAQEPQTGVVVTITAANLNVRSGAGTNYRICGSVRKGEQYTITETAQGSGYLWGKYSGGWICLEYTNYDSVTAEKPSEPETAPVVTGTVKVSSYLCVRSGPSTGYSVVAKLSNGTRVEITEQKVVGAMLWGKIPSGWVSMDYIVLDSTNDAPEATEPQPTEPQPTEPQPTEPQPTEPQPTEPQPTEPQPTEPQPTEPQPTEPQPTEPQPTEPQPTVWNGTVKVNSVLRVRSGPGTSYGIAGYLYNNNRVTVTEQTTVGSTTWGKTAKGWVSMEYIVLDETDSNAGSGSQNTPAQTVTGTVTAKQPLRIRSGAGTSYSIVGYLKSNAKVEILEQKTVNGAVWGRVAKGWVSMDYIALDGAQPPAEEKPQTTIKTVTASCLRVRSAAGTNNSIVGYLYAGSKVEILETQTVNGAVWGRITKGWISMDYVK